MFEEFLRRTPVVEYCPAYDKEGLKGLFFEGPPCGGKTTRVFALLGMPKEAADGPVPAVVLVHGGGGHAFAPWVKLWNERGYAALAMENTGYFPADEHRQTPFTEQPEMGDYQTRFAPEAPYASTPDNDGVKTLDRPLTEQWMYHAIAVTLISHAILKGLPQVDPAKIGVCGVSWGGVITTLTLGYDPEWAFAVPIYGSAYLETTPASIAIPFAAADPQSYVVATGRLCRTACPTLWLCWNDDTAFDSRGNSRSYEATRERGARLCIRDQMGHGHRSAWEQPESYVFADSVVKGTAPLPTVTRQQPGVWTVSAVPASARLFWASALPELVGGGLRHYWHTSPAVIDGNRVTATVPPDACDAYLEVGVTVDGTACIVTSAVE